MLVVVHHGDVHFGFEACFDFKAFGGFDVFEIDAAECRAEGLDDGDEFFGVFLVDFDVVAVESGENLEEQSLTLHDRFAGQRADVAEAEHGCAVGYYGHKVAFVGVVIGFFGGFLYFETGICHAGRVCQGQIGLCGVWFGGDNFDFAGARIFVIVQRHLLCNFCHVGYVFILLFELQS